MPGHPVVTRFAPSPTGYLHLGHAHSALFGWTMARQSNGRFLLRIEDIDPTRCRPEFDAALRDDLAWLGLDWEEPVRRQSEHFADYAAALETLRDLGLLYPCFCTRKDIAAEIASAGRAPHGPEGPLYPGTCRSLDPVLRAERIAAGAPHALRLDAAAAAHMAGPLTWVDILRGTQTAEPQLLGDVVLARKEFPASYHLAVTVDDHIQGVTHVTRGEDLFFATHLHRLLQKLLRLETPVWCHHRLLTNGRGERLAKRDGAATLRSLRDQGKPPVEVRTMASSEIHL